MNYLPDAAAIERALVRVADAVRPGGLLALDVCDLAWGQARRDQPDRVRVEEDWALITRTSLPSPDRYVREMTVFVRADGGCWRRDDERHDNILVDTATIPDRLARHGLAAGVASSFGTAPLPEGLKAVVGWCR